MTSCGLAELHFATIQDNATFYRFIKSDLRTVTFLPFLNMRYSLVHDFIEYFSYFKSYQYILTAISRFKNSESIAEYVHSKDQNLFLNLPHTLVQKSDFLQAMHQMGSASFDSPHCQCSQALSSVQCRIHPVIKMFAKNGSGN